jgi:hypothetical protein
MGTQPGFFDVDHRMKRLSDLGDQLEAFGSAVTAISFWLWPIRRTAKAVDRHLIR